LGALGQLMWGLYPVCTRYLQASGHIIHAGARTVPRQSSGSGVHPRSQSGGPWVHCTTSVRWFWGAPKESVRRFWGAPKEPHQDEAATALRLGGAQGRGC
jgi:hypothetical protein